MLRGRKRVVWFTCGQSETSSSLAVGHFKLSDPLIDQGWKARASRVDRGWKAKRQLVGGGHHPGAVRRKNGGEDRGRVDGLACELLEASASASAVLSNLIILIIGSSGWWLSNVRYARWASIYWRRKWCGISLPSLHNDMHHCSLQTFAELKHFIVLPSRRVSSSQ